MSVEWSIVLFAISICAIIIPDLSLFSDIEGHLPWIITKEQGKLYSNIVSPSRFTENILDPSLLNETLIKSFWSESIVSKLICPSKVAEDKSYALVKVYCSTIPVSSPPLLSTPIKLWNNFFPSLLKESPKGFSAWSTIAVVAIVKVDKSYGVAKLYSFMYWSPSLSFIVTNNFVPSLVIVMPCKLLLLPVDRFPALVPFWSAFVSIFTSEW